MVDSVAEIIEKVSPYYKAKGSPTEEFGLVYDSTSETLEPVYFWILDFMNSMFEGDVKKMIDNFTSSPGSGHFSELGMRATRMQEEGMKILGAVNTVLKSIINLIYDLKEFEIRLSHYNSANSKDKGEAESGLLSLKQMWMDNVDVKRGRGAINMMAQDLNFITLRDAFMISKSVEEVDKMDLNERVKRILKPRLKEFFEWKKRSETELKKRFEIEKAYLKSQVSSLQLYTRWAKPYIVAAERLRMKDRGEDASLVNIFNTLVLQLTLFAKSKIKVKDLIIEDNEFPKEFARRKFKRDYYSCVLVNFLFRGIPQRISGQQAHYVFGGRTEVTFSAYCLNDDEMKLLDEEMKKGDIADAMMMVEGITTESLEQLKGDIDYFLKSDEEREKEEKEKKKSENVNPFSALIGSYNNNKEKKKDEREKAHLEELKKKGAKKDGPAEAMIRNFGTRTAGGSCYTLFDTYKKSHGMPSYPSPYEDFVID